MNNFYLHTRYYSRVTLLSAPNLETAKHMAADWNTGYHTGTLTQVRLGQTIEINGQTVVVSVENSEVYDPETKYTRHS